MSDTDVEEKVFEVEIAKNGRAGCKKCKQKCMQGELRIAKIVPNPFGDGKMRNWHHLDCLFEVFKKQRATTKRIEHYTDINGFDTLPEHDQKLIKEKISEISKFFGSSEKCSPQKKQKTSKVEKNNSELKVKDENTKDDLFKTFQNIVTCISNHPSYLDKTNIVKTFFHKGDDGKGFKGDVEIWCRLLLPQSDKRIYNLQSKQLVKVFSRMFLEDQDEMLEHLEKGDVSETITCFYQSSRKFKPLPKDSTVSVQEIDSFLGRLSKLTKEEEQISHFESILPKLTPDDLKYIIRLIKHDLRMGAGPKHILEGIHPDAFEVYKASKNLDDVVSRCFGNSKLQSAEIKVMTPVFPMLAEPCKSVEHAMKKCPNGMFAEIKYDGERVQVHKRGNEFKYFSRALKPVLAHKVSHFHEHIPKAFPNANDLILDSEILMMDTNTGQPLPFGTLGVHKKAQFRDATVCLFVFDCLYYNGKSLLNVPIRDRKQILKDNMIEIPHRIVFSEMQEITQSKDLTKMIASVLKEGLEGLVLKDQESKYEPGKRHWMKVKKDYLFEGAMADTADLIVLGAWYGTGRKGGMMSVFLMGCYDESLKKFCTVTKVHTGHDDKTLDRLQKELQMEKISGDPNKVPSWLKCTRTMVPDFVAKDPKEQPVWEITGAEFTQIHDVHTADGISIRFPRVTKIRDDKDWKTATNLDELKTLFKKSKENTDVSMLLKGLKNDKAESKNNKRKQVEEDDDDTDLDKSIEKRLKSENSSPNKKSKQSKTDEPSTSTGISNKQKSLTDYVKKNAVVEKPANKRRKVDLKNPLPDYFKNVKAIFDYDSKEYNEAVDEYKRYFVAYGGLIPKDDQWDFATHVIHFKNMVKKVAKDYPKIAIHVNVRWIKDTIAKGELQDYRKYVVKWIPS